ncbi:hypothetical protein [Evansella tamaricis]|uniref:Uncharacterized protein n=1 Tax=Evansella tamaricis TaxID=2069301 RepID=A0ABS6JBK5_9BACI|nr:hypothetical protein [Evansella tamaricis]MBU9711057.1 hypothetical protein [Evansella tamaricis]
MQIDYTDPFLDQSITITTNEENNSLPEQTANGVYDPSYKFAALDGTWDLEDGSYALMADDGSDQVGWWGNSLSDENGEFAEPYPMITMSFFSRPINRLRAVGDSQREEWPVDFTITLYDAEDNVLHQEVVTDNDRIHWTKNITPVSAVVKLELQVHKWSHPGRVVKILELFTSIRQTYEGDDIFLISLQEERDIPDGSLPIGNISANEIEIRLNNIDRRFDAGNESSVLYQLLKANRRIQVWVGLQLLDKPGYLVDPKQDISGHAVDPQATISKDAPIAELFNFLFGMDFEYTESVEWHPLGTFWSGDWLVPENEVWAHTTGRDRLELLRKTTFSISQIIQDTNLYEIAKIVLEDAGLREDEYWIDEELQEFEIPYSWFEPIPHRRALRMIAEACLGQVYQDRQGVVRVEGPSFLRDERTQSQTYLSRDDYFDKDQPIAWSEIANYIEVQTNPLRPSPTVEEVYVSNEPESIEAGQNRTITVYYNERPVLDPTASIDGTGSIANVNYYAWGADITVTSSISGEFTLKVEGRPLRVLNRERIVRQDAESIQDNGKIDYEFPDNHLIQRRATAQRIAEGLLIFSNPRRDIKLNWRGDPTLSLADRFTAPDFKDLNDADFHVISQSLEYDGGLTSTIKGRRAPD